MAEWVTAADVATWANVSESDFGGLAQAVAAARGFVEEKRSDLPWQNVALPEGDPDRFVPSDRIRLGACMLAWRLVQRKGSALGTVTSFDGQAGQILRYDPDIQQLLGIGREGGFLFSAARPPVVTT